MLTRHTRYDIDLDVIAYNFGQVKKMLQIDADGKPAKKIPSPAVVLKADAYGLGAVPVAKVLIREGAAMLLVATLSEALQLRHYYKDVPIMIMGHTPEEFAEIAVEHDITCTVFELENANAISIAAKKFNKTANIHIKIDTGMNRIGIKPIQYAKNEAAEYIKKIVSLPGINAEGIFTHLALCDKAEDKKQFDIFMNICADLHNIGVDFKYRHVCDSIGLMRYPEYRLDMVRAGAVMYGVCPMNTPLSESSNIKTPFCLSTKISRLRELNKNEGVGYDYTYRAQEDKTLIATLPIGYSDGYKRSMSNNGYANVNGYRAKVVGLVCMDQCNIDVTNIPNVKQGDKVVLLGGDTKDNPKLGIPVLEMSNWAHTNRNDIICDIRKRVPRFYWENGKIIEEYDQILNGGYHA